MDQPTKFFKALSELPRLRIVSLLACRSLCVSDLQRLVDASQPYVSRHLAFLRNSGLVRRTRRNGVDVYELNLLDMATHPFVSLVIELQLTRSALQADREKLEQLEAQRELRADRSKFETEPLSVPAPAENKELFDSVPAAVSSMP